MFLFSFFFGLFFNQLKIFNNTKIFYLINFILFTLSLLYISIDVITGQGFTRSFWLHLQSDLGGSTYLPYLIIFLSKSFLFFLFFIIGFFIKKKFFQNTTIKNYYFRITILLAFILLNPASLSLIKSFNLTYGNSNINNNLNFHDYFKSVKNLPKNFSNRDLIVITAESLERTFYTNDNLKKLNLSLLRRNDLIDFTNISQADGYTNWTIAGLVAGNCGLPLVDHSFYPNYKCFTDLLSEKKYNLMSVQGTSPKYSGNGNFYKVHNVDKIVGFNEIKSFFSEKDLELSHWGVHDDIVFDYALNQIKNFENKDNPYAIWVNTVDNHPPNGLLSSKCKKISEHIASRMLKVVYCSDIYLNNFINQIIKEDKKKNNLIIIHSDHLLMSSSVVKKYFKNKQKRKNLFLIIDPYQVKQKKEINTQGNTLDIPATISDYLNGNNTIGLGVSLLSSDDKKIKSLSDNEQELSGVIKIFEKDLININKKIVFLNAKVLPKKNSVEFKSGFRLNIPLLSIDDELIKVETDAKGVPRKRIENMIFDEIIKKNKKINFKAIVNCEEFNFTSITETTQCEFMLIHVSEKKKVINMKIYPYRNNFSEDLFISKKISKEQFISKIKNLNDNPNTLKASWKNFQKNTKKNIENYLPWLYPYAKKVYISLKYSLKKVYFTFSKDKKNLEEEFLLKKDIFIAHAGGNIDGHVYTNSLEALNKNYNLGVKYFELDLQFTSDNKIVAVHDWKQWKQRVTYQSDAIPTLKMFLNYKIDNKFTPLGVDQILDWFIRHPDAVLVTDKIDDALVIKKIFNKIKDNLIIELFTEESINQALSNDFTKILISQKILWKNKYSIKYLNLLLSKKNVPYGFAVSKHTIYENPLFFKTAKSLGFKIYVYNVNEEFNNYILDSSGAESEVICNFHNYINGIYADIIPENPLNILDTCH